MGVPGFFAWIHKNYKKKNMITNVNKDLNVANLFIDTNCLIHPQCFAILAENKDLKNIDRLENKMINQVITYLNEIIETVDPSKLIYIAIDGVALATTVAIAANNTTFIDLKQVIPANATPKTITGGASATSINFHISGVEIV